MCIQNNTEGSYNYLLFLFLQYNEYFLSSFRIKFQFLYSAYLLYSFQELTHRF